MGGVLFLLGSVVSSLPCVRLNAQSDLKGANCFSTDPKDHETLVAMCSLRVDSRVLVVPGSTVRYWLVGA